MKKLLLTTAFFLIVSFAKAQNTFPSSGNVGMGTTTPNSLLAVYGNSANILKTLSLTNTNTGYNAGTSIYMGYGADSGDPYGIRIIQNGYPASTRSGSFAIQRHGGSAGDIDWVSSFAIDYNGNVGIGTSSPAVKLDVLGTMQATNPNPTIGLIDNSNSNYTWSVQNTAGAYRFYDNTANAERMRITSNGNVLIGQNSQVNSTYKLDIAGSIRASQITVNTTGADFVFEKTYHLKTLKEVSDYISLHKHLPEIPPAEKMEKEGSDIGEMNNKLLQKVEELTLYLINQRKQIQALQKDVKKLKRIKSTQM